MSLTARVTAGALAVVALVLGGGGAVIVTLTERQDRRDFDAALRRELDTLGPPVRGTLNVGPPGGAPVAAPNVGRALDDAFGVPDGTRFLRAAANGRTLARGDVPPGFPPLSEQPGARTVTAGGADWRVVSRTDPEGVTIELAALERPLDERAADLRRIVLITVAVGLVLAALATTLGTRYALRPLEALRRKATAARDTDLRVSEPGQPAEVAALAAELDGLLERIGASAGEREAALEAARRFAADAGHELRTPLQSVRSNLEIAQRSNGDAQALALDTALTQSGRLSRLVDALQSLARGEAGLGATASTVDLGEVADGAVFAARTRHPGKRITLEAPASGPIMQGDSDGLWRVLENLLENAALHGGDTIRVTVSDGPRIAVDDDGPGVAPEDRERLQERFARGGHSGRPGSGLGLAIVAAEARRHGGSLSLQDSDLGGLRAVVSLG
jgi:two-component system sensor histidine kinase PrrB